MRPAEEREIYPAEGRVTSQRMPRIPSTRNQPNTTTSMLAPTAMPAMIHTRIRTLITTPTHVNSRHLGITTILRPQEDSAHLTVLAQEMRLPFDVHFEPLAGQLGWQPA